MSPKKKKRASSSSRDDHGREYVSFCVAETQSHGDCPSEPRLHFPPSYSPSEPLPYHGIPLPYHLYCPTTSQLSLHYQLQRCLSQPRLYCASVTSTLEQCPFSFRPQSKTIQFQERTPLLKFKCRCLRMLPYPPMHECLGISYQKGLNVDFSDIWVLDCTIPEEVFRLSSFCQIHFHFMVQLQSVRVRLKRIILVES